MREVDRIAIEELGLDLPRMMENAGRALASLARRRFLDDDVRGRHILVLAGKGGNGGGAITAGRRLLAWGAHVDLRLASAPATMTPVSRQQLELFLRFGGTPTAGHVGTPDLVIDGILGYSQDGPPRGEAAGALALPKCGLLRASPDRVGEIELPPAYRSLQNQRHGAGCRGSRHQDHRDIVCEALRGLHDPSVRDAESGTGS